MSEKAQAGCSECGLVFTKAGNLYRHYRAQHGIKVSTRVCDPGSGEVPCPHCDRLFSKASNMTRHCKIVHKVRTRSRSKRKKKKSGHEGDSDSDSECLEADETSGLRDVARAVLREASKLNGDDLDKLLMKAAETKASFLPLTKNT